MLVMFACSRVLDNGLRSWCWCMLDAAVASALQGQESSQLMLLMLSDPRLCQMSIVTDAADVC